ncbi:MAG: GNAT family N-acetyltransferase [Geobacter sp.]|nr:GNAT family N-acetyltransferase [Geobacter sp.]
MKIQAISNIKDLAALKNQWNDLLAASASDSVFLTHEWLYTWWEVFGNEYELFVLTCRNEPEGHLVGIFPAYLKTAGFPIRTRSVRLLGSEHVTSDFLECIALKGLEEEVYGALFVYLVQKSDLWDLIEITDVPEQSVFAGFLRRQGILPAFTQLDNEKFCPYLPLPSNWDEFLSGLSSKTRRNVRYYRNNLGRHAIVDIEEVTTLKQLHEVMPDMVRLHQERKQQVGYSGRFSSQSYKRFHDAICESFLNVGRLLLVFLKVDGKRVAFYYNFTFQGRVNVYQSGFDIEWSKFSVGALLLGHIIEMSITGGNKYIDFLRGHEQYKYHWTEQERKLMDYVSYNNSLRGSILKITNRSLSAAKSGLKKVLPEIIQNNARRVMALLK